MMRHIVSALFFVLLSFLMVQGGSANEQRSRVSQPEKGRLYPIAPVCSISDTRGQNILTQLDELFRPYCSVRGFESLSEGLLTELDNEKKQTL